MRITTQSLQEEYIKKIPKKFKLKIEKYIDKQKIQTILNKANKGILTKTDYNNINKLNEIHPKFYWLSCIYIHPLTILSEISKKLNRI